MKGYPIIVKQLLQKAKDSALLAVEYYNKPAVSFKSEGFIVMMCIAWTSMFHAYFLKNKIKPWYRKTEKGKRPRYDILIEKLPNGQEIKDKKWWDLNMCLSEFYKANNNDPVYFNIKFLSGLRNLIVHRNLPELDASIFAECQANILNFNDYLIKHFGEKQRIDIFLSFSIQMFRDPVNIIEATKEELKKKSATEVIDYIKNFRNSLSVDVFENPQYAFKAVLIQVKNHQSKDSLALRFIHEKDLTEEQKEQLRNIGIVLIKEKTVFKDEIPENCTWVYKDLLKAKKVELPSLPHSLFEKFKKYFQYKFNDKINPNLKSKEKLVFQRIHNPKSKKPQSTFYYDPKIIDEFKRLYPSNITTSNESIVKKIEALVDQILTAKKANPQADTSHWEKEIDRFVYQLYDLTEEEIRVVEG